MTHIISMKQVMLTPCKNSSKSVYNQLITMSDVVHTVVIQVRVLLRQRLKLIVMISLSIHMMTSQDRICVRCVTNGLQWKDIWMITDWDILEKSCIRVLSVSNVLLIGITWENIWMFTAVNTSALNVESVLETMLH